MPGINSPKELKESVTSLLNSNQGLRNKALAKVIEANLIGFKGDIKISNCNVQVEGTRRLVGKKITLSPYRGVWKNFWISIKRFFSGVTFGSNPSPDALLPSLNQGRKITIVFPLDQTARIDTTFESSRKPLLNRIYKTVFSRH